jgi:hypothetical protein
MLMPITAMKKTLALLPFALLLSCSKTDAGGTPPAGTTPPAAGKNLLDKAKEAASNMKGAATTPLDDKSVANLMGIAKELQAELNGAGGAQMDMKALMAKAKDLKVISEKHGVKVSELTGLVGRVAMVMGAMKDGNIPENLKGDVAVIEKHQAELQALFQK